MVAPPISYGSSGEHQAFAGTSSIGSAVLQQTLVELVRSMRTWAAEVVFVNAHGGNLVPLRSAVRKLLDEGHDVAWVACATEDVDLHAGRGETSLMLYLAPWNTIISNVPGPQVPLYFVGARMVTHLGTGPLGDGMGIGHCCLSYNGELTINVTADRAMPPDPAHYADCIAESFAELAQRTHE